GEPVAKPVAVLLVGALDQRRELGASVLVASVDELDVEHAIALIGVEHQLEVLGDPLAIIGLSSARGELGPFGLDLLFQRSDFGVHLFPSYQNIPPTCRSRGPSLELNAPTV